MRERQVRHTCEGSEVVHELCDPDPDCVRCMLDQLDKAAIVEAATWESWRRAMDFRRRTNESLLSLLKREARL